MFCCRSMGQSQGRRSPTTQCGSPPIGRRAIARTPGHFARCAKPIPARCPRPRPEPTAGSISANAGQPPSSPPPISPQWGDLFMIRMLSHTSRTCANKPRLASGPAPRACFLHRIAECALDLAAALSFECRPGLTVLIMKEAHRALGCRCFCSSRSTGWRSLWGVRDEGLPRPPNLAPSHHRKPVPKKSRTSEVREENYNNPDVD